MKEGVDSLFHEGENADPTHRCGSDRLGYDEQAQDRKALRYDEFELHSKHATAIGAQHIWFLRKASLRQAASALRLSLQLPDNDGAYRGERSRAPSRT